jgi:hypothetical protein
MPLLSKKDLVKYFAEMLVVVLGILIAFQVEEWRENVREEREINAALVRLKDETIFNLRICERVVPQSMEQVRMVQVVMESLQTGSLLESDRGQFELGLVKLGWLVYPPYQSTVAEEMISTGLLKELDQAELRSIIARIPGSVESSERQFAVQRGLREEPRTELRKLVVYRFNGSFDASMASESEYGGSSAFVDAIDVSYDFENLAGNQHLKNLVINAADNQVENFGTNARLCRFFQDIDEKLAERGFL